MKLWWAKFTHAMFGMKWVILVDYDEEINIRRVVRVGEKRMAHRRPYGIRTVQLEPEGKVVHGLYCKKWEPLLPASGDLS